MDEMRDRLKRFLGVIDLVLVNPATGRPIPLNDRCGICGGAAPMHVCNHCDRACDGIECRICATENGRYSTL